MRPGDGGWMFARPRLAVLARPARARQEIHADAACASTGAGLAQRLERRRHRCPSLHVEPLVGTAHAPPLSLAPLSRPAERRRVPCGAPWELPWCPRRRDMACNAISVPPAPGRPRVDRPRTRTARNRAARQRPPERSPASLVARPTALVGDRPRPPALGAGIGAPHHRAPGSTSSTPCAARVSITHATADSGVFHCRSLRCIRGI